MPPATVQRRLTVEEYLEADAELDQDTEGVQGRYESLDGRVWLLAGASPEHNLVKDNIRGEIHSALRAQDCRSYTSKQRVKVSETKYVYPDVVVLCGEPDQASISDYEINRRTLVLSS